MVILGTEAVQKNTYKDQAYRIIKDAILNHALETERIYSQDDLCNTLQISRTPVREALLELQNEGYVNFLRGRGVIIPELTGPKAKAVYEMRLYEEPIAARLAAERISEEQISQLHRLIEDLKVEGLTSSAYYRNNRDFHALIYEASGNYLLSKFLEDVMDLYMFSDAVLNFSEDTDWRYPVIIEHKEILDALEKHDPDRAAETMQKHVRVSLERKKV